MCIRFMKHQARVEKVRLYRYYDTSDDALIVRVVVIIFQLKLNKSNIIQCHISLNMTTSLTAHRDEMTSKIRKNNIFGERDDPICISFLDFGGQSIFYRPDTLSKKSEDESETTDQYVIGRTDTKMYIGLVVRTEKSSSDVTINMEQKDLLKRMSFGLGATPVICVFRPTNRQVKWRTIDGEKIKRL